MGSPFLFYLPLYIVIFSSKPFGLSVGAYLFERIFGRFAVGDGIEHQCHEHCRHHVEDGVLFDKYGCENDAAHQGKGSKLQSCFVA